MDQSRRHLDVRLNFLSTLHRLDGLNPTKSCIFLTLCAYYSNIPYLLAKLAASLVGIQATVKSLRQS